MLIVRRTSRPGARLDRLTQHSYFSQAEEQRRIVSIPPRTNIYAFGAPSRSLNPLVRFEDAPWAFEPHQTWAIVSNSTGGLGKGAIFKTLLGHTRVEPDDHEVKGDWISRGGLYPALSYPPTSNGASETPLDPYTRIGHVAFRQRSSIGGELSAEGSFFDYTARYGALRDKEDRVTLREVLSADMDAAQGDTVLFGRLIERVGLSELLDIPLLTLSNGQTRRARIVQAIIRQPALLLLDEPLTGLDVSSRQILNETLQELHASHTPSHGTTSRMNFVIGIRKGEHVPEWISNVLEIRDGVAYPQERKDFASSTFQPSAPVSTPRAMSSKPYQVKQDTPLLMDIQNGNIAYGTRKVLRDINWQIRQGERWHLQGANGSGKTTLLALITGDHPQSFTQPHLYLPSSSSSSHLPRTQAPRPPVILPRKRIPTAHLRRLIGVVSPEMFDAFPRRHPGMSVWEAVGTGFDGGFVPRTKGAPRSLDKLGCAGWVDVADEEIVSSTSSSEAAVDEEAREALRRWRVERSWEVLEGLGPAAWSAQVEDPTAPLSASPSAATRAFAARLFSSLSPGEQRLVLLMRALVGRPPLVLLDEAWSGMDDRMLSAARKYLRSGGGVDERQAVVVITHWDEEVPWSEQDGVLRYKL